MSMAKMLLEKRANVENQARALLDRADAERRTLTAEESQQFDRYTAEMQSLRSQSDRLVQFEADAKDADEALRSIGHRGRGTGGGVDRPDIAAQFRALANGEGRSFELRTTREEARIWTEHRALSKGTATAGGNSVQTSFVNQLVEHLIETATLVNAGATVFQTDSGENLELPITTAHGTAALVAEAGVIPQSDPTFGKRTLGAYKYGDLIIVANELLTDTSVDLEGYLARQAGRAVGNALGAHLITGTGTAQPSGIFTTSTLGVTSATGVAGAPTFDNLIDLQYSVIAPYRKSPEAGWLVKDSTVGLLRKLKDSQGRYLWEPSVVPGTPDRMLGFPVYTDPNVAATGVNNKSVIFGDLSAYVVRIVNGIRFERSEDFKFDTDQTAFRCLIRADGVLADQTGAVKHFVGAAT